MRICYGKLFFLSFAAFKVFFLCLDLIKEKQKDSNNNNNNNERLSGKIDKQRTGVGRNSSERVQISDNIVTYII